MKFDTYPISEENLNKFTTDYDYRQVVTDSMAVITSLIGIDTSKAYTRTLEDMTHDELVTYIKSLLRTNLLIMVSRDEE